MNVRCPDCGTVYRVDPSRVPVAGVRARCVRCPGEFEVGGEERPGARPEKNDRDVSGSAGWSRAASPVESDAGIPGAVVPSSQTVAPAPFGAADPDARARRLARALVSDIVVYHPDQRERSLEQGTIRQDFRNDIRKSWDEYVDQVGNEMARKTSYFQEALNEILAGGARIF